MSRRNSSRWTPEQEDALRRLWSSPIALFEISLELEEYGRADLLPASVRKKARQLGLPKRTLPPSWSPEMDSILRSVMARTGQYSAAHNALVRAGYMRHRSTVERRARQLGLRPSRRPVAWKPDRTARLIAMLRAGHDYGAIAAELGTTVNAIAGRVWRIRNKQRARQSLPSTKPEDHHVTA